LDILAACNVQFALNSLCIEYYTIKVNAGLSCLSAFASKATGYPLAYITAKLVLALNSTELTNNITNATCASFEPSLDYVTIEVPVTVMSLVTNNILDLYVSSIPPTFIENKNVERKMSKVKMSKTKNIEN